jgi:predicted TIM-barrel fold metal-dependent hydrolase
MLQAMDEAQVTQAVLLGWYWEQESTCRWHNAQMAEWMRIAPERLLGFAAIYPNENVLDQLETAHTLGFRGVGELHFGVQAFSAESPHWQAMAKWCVAHDWPINCHATETAGHEHPGSIATPLQEFVRMAQAEPELKLILAHWGGGLPFYEQNPRLRKVLRNVYYDSAASPLLYDIGVFKQMLELVGIEKLLFGSDYPLRIYPRQQKTADMRRYLQNILNDSGLNQAELASFLGGNFKRLLAGVVE